MRLLIFVAGMVSIGIEIAASRLVAPYFGTSTFVWANLIGATLAFLAIGYYLGGRLADRRPHIHLLYVICLLAAIATALAPIFSEPVLRISLDAFDTVDIGAFYGSLAGVLLLLAAPMTLLGFVTPFAIRLTLAGVDSAGHTAGNIYALSTAGAILGSFLPAIVFVPLLGTRWTFYLLAMLLAGVSLVGLVRSRSTGWVAVSVISVLLITTVFVAARNGPIKPPYRGQLVAEAESAYNYIQVLEDDGRYLLALNEGHAIHSVYQPGRPLTGGPWDYFGVAPLFLEDFSTAQVNKALLVGLAAGTGAHTMIDSYDKLQVDGVEIDPKIIDLARTWFALDDPQLNVIVDDGRYFLNRTSAQYDIIAIDAYKQPYIPFHLTTVEFFELVEEHLTPNGTVAVNVGRTATDYRLVDAITATLRQVYQHVYIIETARFENSIVIATNAPSSVEAFYLNGSQLPAGSVLSTIAAESVLSGEIRIAGETGTVLTDDKAPVEWIVDMMILDAAQEEDPWGPKK